MITATGLHKEYGSTVAVADLTFQAQPGVVTGFLGPNGAGKSTTMRLMLDLDRGAGTTTFDGRHFRQLAHPMREVGALLEARAFHPTRTARNHLRMLAAANALPSGRIDEVLAMVGLTEVAGRKPKGFSLGMGQRLGLAAALLGDPHTLLLDEPANGLDPAGIQWLRDLLKALAAQGRTIFVSSHLLAEMALMADELVVIGRGRLIHTGSVGEFVSRFTTAHVLVRSPQAAQLADLLRPHSQDITTQPDDALLVDGPTATQIGDLAAANGLTLHELSPQTASLEEAFLSATGGDEEFVGGRFAPPDPDGRGWTTGTAGQS